jgi:hypothetical protein
MIINESNDFCYLTLLMKKEREIVVTSPQGYFKYAHVTTAHLCLLTFGLKMTIHFANMKCNWNEFEF